MCPYNYHYCSYPNFISGFRDCTAPQTTTPLLLQYQELARSLQHLNGYGMNEADGLFPLPTIPDVSMGCMLIDETTEHSAIGTSGLNCCIAFCARGSTLDGKTYLGICHSPAMKVKSILRTFRNEFEARDCLPWKTEIYAIGGILPDKEMPEGSLQNEIDILTYAMSRDYPIKGVAFNIVEGEDALDVILTKDHIFYSKNLLFHPLKGHEEAGLLIDSETNTLI